jgi:aminoglycoside phosphotransferase (APT) family kinase protein
LAPGWQNVAESLLAEQPPAMAPAVVHGDFRLGNLLADGPTVTAVIDWEIWSVGDPRVDLGWFLINADPATYRRRTPYTGLLPTPSVLACTYAEHVGREVPALAWFQALACFKSTATWSLIVKHNRRRETPDPVVEEIAGTLPGLLERATVLLS